MNKSFFIRCVLALCACLSAAGTRAEDIDIFSSAPTAPGAPNVLIILDNSAKWSQSFGSGTKFAAVKSSLAAVVTALKTQFNLGVMLNTETSSGDSTTDGGYVRFAVQPMSASDGSATDARNCLLQMSGLGSTCVLPNSSYYTNLDIGADKGNNTKLGLAMNEAYNYFAGVNAYAGNNKVKTDFTRAFASGTKAGPRYNPPLVETCGKNYIIYINNGAFVDNNSDTATAISNLIAAGGSATPINPPDNGTSKNTAGDEWTKWLNQSPATNAITYTVEVGPETTGQGPYTTQMLQSMGTQGKGGYYSATTAQQLLDALTRIFNDIQAVNSVFASSSLPLSADNSGAFANQVYMGVFRPDAQGKPRWLGNLKQYQFAVDLNSNLSIVDALGQPAGSSKGFAQPDAVSFWTSKAVGSAPDAPATAATNATNGSTGGFWFFDSKGSGGPYDKADGEWIEKGGAAQQLRLAYLGYGGRGGIGDTNASTLNSKPARKVYTCTTGCNPGSALSGTPFDSTNAAALTIAALGAADATELTAMLKWVRGQDTQNENGFQVNSTDTDVRPSIHGDVLHSRPVVLNYGSPATSDNVFVFYGGNDGLFRAIKGGQAATDGAEQWAFIPPEFFGRLKRQYSNSPQVQYPSTPASGITPAPTKRDYAFDGPVATYIERDGAGAINKAYLYLGMRRGGRFIYALDVSDPVNPKFMWKKSSSDTGMGELGQTWSQPRTANISGYTNPVLIFGAGYDAASEDPEPPALVDTIGRGIYMLDAVTGAPIWAASKAAITGITTSTNSGMDFSIPSDIVVLDHNFDGSADRIYATDVGGNIWRVDITDYASRGSWVITKLAALAQRTAGSTTAATRKFMYGTEVVLGDTFDAVFAGSGDREHPLSSNAAQSVVNRFYMIKDVTGLVGSALGVTDTCGATFSTSCSNLADATSGGSTPVAVPADALGWSIKFRTGEKVVNGPLVVAGHILFGTNQPDTSGTNCNANLGIARRYDITFNVSSTQLAVGSDIAPGGGFLPPVVAGVVEIGGQKYLFTTDNPLSPGGPNIKPVISGKRARTHWRHTLN